MSKKKKKPSNKFTEQKLQQARRKNEFQNKLREICTVIESTDMYYSLPKVLKEYMYQCHGTYLKIRGEKGLKIKRVFMEYLDKNINNALDELKMELVPESGRTVSYLDFFRIVLPLKLIFKYKIVPFKDAARFDSYSSIERELFALYIKMLERVMHNSIYFANDYRDKFLYTGQYRVFSGLNDSEAETQRALPKSMAPVNGALSPPSLRTQQELIINMYPLETRIFKLGGDSRSAIRVGKLNLICLRGSENTFTPVSVPLNKLKKNASSGDLPVSVYIQQHAIDRLIERLYRLPSELMDELIYSLDNLEAEDLGNNKYRITYYLQELKAGYIIANYVDGCLLIRTFLFLTNNGTPEGKLLEEQTGLQLADKKYFALDKLGSLIYSDLLENEPVCQMFINAGCGSIIELCRKNVDFDYDSWLWAETVNRSFNPAEVYDYINKMKENDDYLQF